MNKNIFDFNNALDQLKAGQELTVKDGVLHRSLNNSLKPL
jgi:hypothetical protein